MALQESLNRFNKQQEKCLSTFSSTTVRAGPSKATQHQKDAVRATPSAYKFTNDLERLQLINSIRKSTAGAQIKRVIDLLLKSRESLTAEEIYEACYVDVKANKTVFDSLTNNPRVTFNRNHFSYKPKHSVNNKAELLSLIKKEFCEGVAVTELEEVYPTVMEDLQALKASREIWIVPQNRSKEKIAYPDDLHDSILVDDDLKCLFREIDLPQDMIDIEKDLKKNRMIPATDTAKRQVVARASHGTVAKSKQERKERRLSKRTKLTNAHVPELWKYFYGPAT
ncbi:hypothetical protein ACHQM5_011315 [Ranunculus cassubicifolius]